MSAGSGSSWGSASSPSSQRSDPVNLKELRLGSTRMLSPSIVPPSLTSLPTESRNPMTTNIDEVNTLDLCRLISDQDAIVSRAVSEVLPVIAIVIDAISERLLIGGRLLYMGAGTSGRIGVLDAAELPATFDSDPMQFVALVAGGDSALRNYSSEGIEDSREAGTADLNSLQPNPEDILIGISSSGQTPYVLGALEHSRELGMLTVGLACVRPSAMSLEGHCDYIIDPMTGPEVLAGSTRLKAGTATKMILNMISTGVHIKIGKTYGNLMVDVKASNTKLVNRARRIIRTIGAEVGVPPSYASIFTDNDMLDAVVRRCGGSVKLALVVVISGWGVDMCTAALERRNGVLKATLEDVKYETIVRVFGR